MSKWNRYDEQYGEDYAKADYHSAKAGVRIFGISIGAVLAIFVITALIGGLTWLWAPWKGSLEARQKTVGSGDYRIAAYDDFFNACASIQSTEDQIANLKTERETAPLERQAYIDASITALRNSRATLIRQYNADARKEDTRAHFRSSDLPYEIDINEENTTCAS